jgi:hypothetical protein
MFPIQEIQSSFITLPLDSFYFSESIVLFYILTLYHSPYHLIGLFVGGPKRNWKHSQAGGPVIVHASATSCLLRGPFYINLLTGVVK